MPVTYIRGTVLRCDLISHFLTEIWDRGCWSQKSWHFLFHFQSENGNKYSRWPGMEVLPRRLKMGGHVLLTSSHSVAAEHVFLM